MKMNKIVVFILMSCLSLYANAQSKAAIEFEKQNEERAEMLGLDCMPQYNGGLDSIVSYLQNNIHYPEKAYVKGEEGCVVISFVVHKDGSIVDVTVVQQVSDALDKEAVRVISSMPKWKPATKNGIPVPVRYALPVNFRMPQRNRL